MADNKILEQMLEHLVNDEKEKAEELFHEYVVARSREIYESLIESEMKDEEDDEEDVEEATDKEDEEDEKVEEEFEEFAAEADDDMGGDPTDDLEAELDDEMDDDEDMEDKDPEELFQDLDAIVDELQAKFDAMKGGEEGDDMGDEEMKDDFDLETVREYVEKVPTAKMGDNGVNTKSLIDNMKNDMGGTSANIVSGGESKGEGTKGGLLNPSPKEDNAGNINVPGGKAGGAFSKKEPGHGAEKKGAAEQADKSAGSLFRGRR